MSIEIIRSKDIEKLSEQKQLEFFKKRFQYQHCELDGCGHEVRNTWGIYDDTLYCESCFDWNIENEKDEALKQLEYHKSQITELNEKFNFD